ncbi:DUF1800 domain-containing protein [Variovorax sp. PCZ-1]|uniref:DUF1800 domain-containing protein n=1 Tax=Variovorax sp. PCZ-1 TaxID=2835533 RepID=UPI001BCD6446|nr:DUF1800 domain-containing protein [Variovorax sp. PCZ-1]MBS7809203.1 DUF1800 domain-containing protein [Variovorax sp. PCZ-1]
MKKTLLATYLSVICMGCFAQALPDTSAAAVWRATSRLGYGPTPALVQAAQNNARAWSLAQLDLARQASQRPAKIPPALQALAASQQQVSARFHEEREARKMERNDQQKPASSMQGDAAMGLGNDTENYSRDMQLATGAWRLASCSNPDMENPLLARMTEFWFNHFNVFIGKGPVRPYVGNYLLTAIRPHALGKFEDLLLATAQHPAMLFYLDQAQSTQRGLNENYARELMELHTLGVNGGYTQADVREMARVLTGWSVDINGGQGFLFRPRAHEDGSKTVMGQSFTESGQAQGIAAIKILAQHPATAQRISARLATFFVADKPSKALTDRLARTFTQTGGDIHAVMKSLIESPEFWESANTLFKTPMDYACSSLAAAGNVKEDASRNQNLRQATGFLAQAGQPLHGWQTPDGYKTDAGTWLAPEALTRRADYAFGLASRIDEPSFLQQFYTVNTRERIAKERAVHMRTGLLLAAPEFMSK